MKKPKEKILEHIPAEKFVSICAWCECPNGETGKPFTDAWKKKGYNTSHGMCEDEEHF